MPDGIATDVTTIDNIAFIYLNLRYRVYYLPHLPGQIKLMCGIGRSASYISIKLSNSFTYMSSVRVKIAELGLKKLVYCLSSTFP